MQANPHSGRGGIIAKPIAFFDLDGTLRDTYGTVYPRAHQVTLFSGVVERLQDLRQREYLIVGITNQGGVSKGQISPSEVEKANLRTQELLGESRLDLILYCPHYGPVDGRDCDCKKPAPGMLLDALTAISDSTLNGAFVVGDNAHADGGAAAMLDLPFLDAAAFRRQPLVDSLNQLKRPSVDRALDDDKVAGALVGLATGDALGAPVEFWPRSKVKQMYPDGLKEMRESGLWAAGEYTDDTQMALLIADSLLECACLDPRDVAARFRQWARSAKDVGIQTRRVMSMRGYDLEPETCARLDYESHPKNAAGNGALMRCAPIALFHNGSRSMLLADSRRSARITHGDPKAQSSCVLVNMAITHFIAGGDRESPWRHGMAFLTEQEQKTWSRLEGIASLPENAISGNGYTVSSVEAAFWSFTRTKSFEAAVELAASLGEDADTTAAITGALAGAFYGFEAIPIRWKDKLKDMELIRHAAIALSTSRTVRDLQDSGSSN